MNPQDIFDRLRMEFIKNRIPIPDKIIDSKLYYMSSISALGKCKNQDGQYKIYLSRYAMNDEKQIEATLAHELVHTIYGCMNHGVKFKKYAAIVYDRLGIQVDTRASKEQAEISGITDAKINHAKYVIQCQECGTKIYRQKRSNLVLHPERYRCKCGGILKLLS